MFTRVLVLGILVVGAVGQMACSQTAEAAQQSTLTDADAATPDQQPEGGQFCGGLAAIQCPEGLLCVDDPSDSCDPEASGADCGGICVLPDDKKPKCDYTEEGLTYISRDPIECPALYFRCPEGETPFFNNCGCGCQKTGTSCNYEDPNRRYISQEPDQCAAIRFVCDPGETAFFDSCGCGCELPRTP